MPQISKTSVDSNARLIRASELKSGDTIITGNEVLESRGMATAITRTIKNKLIERVTKVSSSSSSHSYYCIEIRTPGRRNSHETIIMEDHSYPTVFVR